MTLDELLAESLGKESLWAVFKCAWHEQTGSYDDPGKVVFTSDSESKAKAERKKLQDAEKGSSIYKAVYDYVKPV
jgi:hypothetical protein